MGNEACPLPRESGSGEFEVISHMLDTRRIAVVGVSDDPFRPSHYVTAYLQQQGYEIIPINPTHASVLGMRCLPSLEAMDRPADIVVVFRRAEHCAGVTEEAIAARAKGVWLQSGIRSEEAMRLAREAGIDFIQDRCIMVEHGRSGR